MPRNSIFNFVGIAFLMLGGAGIAQAQPAFSRTKLVDPSGTPDANFTKIQDAIDDVPDDPSVRYTILIYAGTYDTQAIKLDDTQENIDLVGVDRDAVIIKAPANTDAITIEGFGARNNTIRNLTIITDDDDEDQGRGIVIKRPEQGSGDDPSAIKIIGVTIQCDGDDSNGLDVEDSATDLEIRNTRITTADGHGIKIIEGDGAGAPANITIERVTIEAGGQRGLFLRKVEDVLIVGSSFRGQTSGAYINGNRNIELHDCLLAAAGARDDLNIKAAWIGDHGTVAPEDILLRGCRLEAINDGTGKAIAADIEAQDVARFLDCQFQATNSTGPAIGVHNGGGENVFIIGGSISTAAPERETYVWDLEAGNPAQKLRASGVRFSKFKGPIHSAGRPRSVVQRTIDVAAPSAVAILTWTALTDQEQPDVTPTGQPDVYRVLSVQGMVDGMTQYVYIVGTDWAGNQISDKIQLNGTAPVAGVKPFKTVDHIILPAKSNGLQSVSVGTTSRLGLRFPVSAVSDVQQLGKKASNENSYTLISIGQDAVDAVYATVDVGTIAADDSFEWAVLASE